MHHRNCRAHYQGAGYFSPAYCFDLASREENQPQSNERNDDGQGDGQCYQRHRIAAHSSHAHRFHPDVVHGCDAGAHEEASGEGAPHAHVGAAHYKKRDGRSEDGRQQRDHYGRPIVLHRDWQAESEHADIVHRPYAEAHGGCTAGEPCESRPAACGSHATGQIERCVGSANGDDYRKRDQPIVVKAFERDIHWGHGFSRNSLASTDSVVTSGEGWRGNPGEVFQNGTTVDTVGKLVRRYGKNCHEREIYRNDGLRRRLGFRSFFAGGLCQRAGCFAQASREDHGERPVEARADAGERFE